MESVQSIKKSFIWYGLQISLYSSFLISPTTFPYWLKVVFYFIIVGLIISFYKKLSVSLVINENNSNL